MTAVRMQDQRSGVESLIEQAHGPDPVAAAGLLEAFRHYLRLLARTSLGAGLRGETDPLQLGS